MEVLMVKASLRLISPTTEYRTVMLRRPPNAELRTREHLTADEVERLIEAAKDNRYGRRDALMALLAYRHGLRAAEVVDLRWEQVDFKTATLHVRRAKNGTPATHPLTGSELRALRRHQKDSQKSPFVFMSERGAPLSAPGFSRMIERAAVAAKLGIKAHAHMLRHSTGFKLANDGIDTRALQAYLGHRNIQNTTRYTALAPDRFKGLWRD
jgi:type 1 fimbriae regulatory protein FimB/type 1 fimbriae regulatory protein FimE